MTKNFHELERARHEARERVKLEYVKTIGYLSIAEFNKLQKEDIKTWLQCWTEIHRRLESKGLATSITCRCNHLGLVYDETDSSHLNAHEFCKLYAVEPRHRVELTNCRPREWFYVE